MPRFFLAGGLAQMLLKRGAPSSFGSAEVPMFLDPAARMQLYGPDGLADHELLAFLLTRGGAPGEAAVRTARDVLEVAGALASVSTLGEAELVGIRGVGPSRARRIRATSGTLLY